MARTISQIQQALLDQAAADGTLGTLLTSTSNVAIWRLWIYVVAFCQWTVESLFDRHVDEVNSIIATQKPHTLQWYVTKAKEFEYGINLYPDSDEFNNSLYTDEQIENAKVISYAAATEIFKGIRIKVATLTGTALGPVPDVTGNMQLTAFKAYMNLVRDAGVRLFITTGNADSLKLSLNIYYNALILGSDGKRLDGTNDTPVKSAIDNYLENLPFNGLYTNFGLLNAIAAVDGVVIPDLIIAQAKYGALPFSNIATEYQPDAGYLRNQNTDLTLKYIPHVPI